MIYFRFEIAWPWIKESGENKTYFSTYKQLSKNKSLETQFSRWANSFVLLDFNLDTRWAGRDHAGFEFSIQVGRYNYIFNLYDHRHWNYDEGRWPTEAEIQAEIDEYKETGV